MLEMNLSHSEPWPALEQVRILAAGTKVETPGATFGPRTQFSWEFVWVREGSLRASLDRTAIACGSGSVLLVPPRVVDQYDWGAESPSRHSFVHFDFARPGAPWPEPSNWPRVRQFHAEHAFFALFQHLLDVALSSPLHSARLAAPCVDLMMRMFLVDAKAAFDAPLVLPRAVEKCLTYAREHLQSSPELPLSLDALAEVSGVSPQHVCRLFKRTLALGPMECVRLLRLERSLTLLERTDLQVQEVARRCGFASAFHYSRAFRDAFGRSPLQYKKAFRQGHIPRGHSPVLRALEHQPMYVDESGVRHYILAVKDR